MFDYLVEKLADWLGEMSAYHVVCGGDSIGLEILHDALRKHPATGVTFSIMPGLALEAVVLADAVLVLGSDIVTWQEVTIAQAEGKVIIPVSQTGGCGEYTADQLERTMGLEQRPGWWDRLRSAERHKSVWKAVESALFDSRPGPRFTSDSAALTPGPGRLPSDTHEA